MRRNTLFVIVGVFTAVLVSLGIGVLVWGEDLAHGRASHAPQPAAPPVIPVSLTPASAFTGPDILQPQAGLTAQQLQSAWQHVAEAAEQGPWDSWGLVKDADTGEVLLDVNGDVPHTPASTMKTLTGAFALATLDIEDTLATGVSQEGDQLYLWGEGDLMLAEGTGDRGKALGYAGLKDLADQVAKHLSEQSLTQVDMVYQDSLFDSPKRNPAWVEQEVESYAGDVGPFAVETGKVSPGAWEYVDDSAATVAHTLASHLEALGVSVRQVTPTSTPPEYFENVVAEVKSAPIGWQIQHMLLDSDNTLAEQYCHLATAQTGANTSFEGSADAMHSFLDSTGINTTGLHISDCSGLDDRSKISALTLTGVLENTRGGGSQSGALTRMLPVGGYSGTLFYRLTGEGTKGNVSGKTGTLGPAAALSGLLTTRSGQNLLFAVGNDNVPGNGGGNSSYYLDLFFDEIVQH